MANSQHYADAPTVKLEDYIPTKLFRTVRSGDVIVFDSVSRMSRNAADGINLIDDGNRRYTNRKHTAFLNQITCII